MRGLGSGIVLNMVGGDDWMYGSWLVGKWLGQDEARLSSWRVKCELRRMEDRNALGLRRWEAFRNKGPLFMS